MEDDGSVMGSKSRKDHLKAISKRLIYLHGKQRRLPDAVKTRSYLMDEIDAIFWLLAWYEMYSEYDVLSIMNKIDCEGLIETKRYTECLERIRFSRTMAIEQATMDG